MNLNIFKKRKSGLTLVVATTLLFAGPVAAHAATTGADNTTDTNGATSASADGNNGIVGTEPGASTATGGIKIVKTDVKGRYGDKYSVNATLDIRVDYAGDKVEKGATFSVALGDGLQVPNGFNSVDLKATALDGTEKKIGTCTASGGTFNCVVTEDIAATLGGNGSLKNGFVKLEATLTKSSIGKTTTDVVVDGTKYTIGLGKGVVGENVTPGDHKFCFSHGKTPEGLYEFMCWIQAQGNAGQTITITENRDDATFKRTVYTTPTEHGDWQNPSATTKATISGKTATFTVPDGTGTQENRIAVIIATSEKTMTNTATINGKEVTDTVTWKAKGSSGAETGEDEKPVTPTPAPTPDPTPEPPKPTPEPDPKPSEPPVAPPVTPDPTPEPSNPPAPTPEPSTPPVTPPVTPEDPKPAPTPDPTPDTPKPDPKPTPEQPTPNPDPKPTPEPSTPPVTPPAPNPEPSQPSTPEKPKPEPSEPSVTPPATPEKPKPEKPAEKPEPKETPKETPSQPSTPDKPGNSASEHKGAVTGLAHTGASDTGLMIAGATALVTAGGIALLLRRRQNNN